jgi:hypothetical protein
VLSLTNPDFAFNANVTRAIYTQCETSDGIIVSHIPTETVEILKLDQYSESFMIVLQIIIP